MGIQEYLAFCVGALEKLEDFPVVHVVVGNEACDLDSAVSAVTFAYYLHETSIAPVGTALFLPLLNIPRSDFPLRTEVTHFLGKFGITPNHLIFLDDLNLASVKDGTDLKVTLVDHHVLSAALSELALEENVVQILDHRPRDGDLPNKCDSTLELVGSCSTLVAEALLADETFTMDQVTATLLYGTIVTDTINFSPTAGKMTPKDLDLAQQLEEVIGTDADRDAIFQDIKDAKFNLSGLTSKQILCKDLKLVKGDSLKVAMSSVTMDMTMLMGREDFLESLKSFATEKAVDAVVVMTVCVGPDDSVTRQLGVFSPSRVYRQQMADVLSACQSHSLGLSPLPCDHQEFLPFTQSNVTASRKQVLPIVKAFLAGDTTPDETQLDAYEDLPKDRSENFTSMSSIVDSQKETFDGDISSEDLISRDNSTEEILSSPDENRLPLPGDRKVFDPLSPTEEILSSPDENRLPLPGDRKVFDPLSSTEEILSSPDENRLPLPGDRKVFDPLSSVHSSDCGDISPTDLNPNAQAEAAESKLPAAEEMDFDPLGKHGGDEEAGEEEEEGWFGDGAKDFTVPSVVKEDVDGAISQLSGASYERLDDEEFSKTDDPSTSPSSSPLVQPSQDAASTTTHHNPPSHHNNNHNHNHQQNPELGQHNGLVEEDALEQDLLNLASPHDLLFPADSPFDVSAATSGQASGVTSGQTSGHTSKQPSYPVTPPNSYMDLDGGHVPKETQLPSFNSSEMVEKIQEKKAAMGTNSSEDTPDNTLSPFTPQNSYAEVGFHAAIAKETQLPSFHSSDMVERIREKRSSMERDLLGAAAMTGEVGEGGVGSSVMAGEGGVGSSMLDGANNPFTPPNSFVDTSLQAYARENLPSFNNAELANRIKERQAELEEAVGGGAAAGGEMQSGNLNPGGLHQMELQSPGGPYTPQNSYRESPLLHSQHVTDLNQVAERLSLTGSESSGSFNEPRSIRASNRVHMQGQSPQDAKSFSVREDSEYGGARSKSTKDRKDEEKRKNEDDEEDEEEEEEEEESSDIEEPTDILKRKGVSFSQQQEDQNQSDVAEAAIQKIAYELANEMIQKALETFPAGSVKQLVPEEGATARELTAHPSISSDSSPIMDLSDREFSPEYRHSPGREGRDSALASSSESELFAAETFQPVASGVKASSSLADELAQAARKGSEGEEEREGREGWGERPWKSDSDEIEREYLRKRSSEEEEEREGRGVRKSESYEVETEYLSEMDPMSFVHSPDIIQTDADREVVEGASFRKISGQENKTVQEEILAQIRREAREREVEKMRQSSVAEEDNLDLSHDEDDTAKHREDVSDAKEKTTAEAEVDLSLDEDATADHSKDVSDAKKKIAAEAEVDLSLDEDAAGHREEVSDAKKKIAAEADLDLDASLRDEEGKKTIRVVRDRELYASALENVDADNNEEPVEKSLQPSNTSHPLLDSSLDDSRTEQEDSSSKKTVHASDFEDSSFVEDERDHSYESFAETSSVGNAEERLQEERRQRSNSSDKTSVARTVSTASDSSAFSLSKRASLKGVELRDEWQDDEIIEDQSQAMEGATAAEISARKRLVPEDGLVVSGDDLEDVEVVDSDSEIGSDMDNEQLEWENDTPVQTPTRPPEPVEDIPQYTAAEERRETTHWKMIDIGEGEEFRLDMKVIEPYKKVLSHGGYYGDRLNAMIVFSACYLPSRDRKDYTYVMDHLFHYVIHTLDELVADDYMIVYFHGATPKRQMPSFSWLKRCYQGIDRRLKKNLKALYLVHPTLWLKTVVLMTRPFISAKFSSKLQFVRTLADLKTLIPMEYVYIPDIVQRYDDRHFHPSSSSSSSSSPPSRSPQ
ncbi:uncharacterized protein [Littorina saxatilis]|uniref:uncharacterized protein isoform X2 n=1 Tax=Littorina saxatilis TaxID=31220 RepID=UPI0038B59D18